MYHIPVLLNESITGLNIRPEGTYVDVTFGSGKHSEGILEKLISGRLIAFDRDKDSEANAIKDPRFIFIRQDYRYLKNFLAFHGINLIDGLLADLGISSHQIDDPERGFSTRFEGKLDMRMDQGQEKDATEIVNNYPEEDLVRIFRDYGEVENARHLVREIIKARSVKAIETTGEFRYVAAKCAPRGKENQYLAKAFQAVRIEVNDELGALKEMLTESCDLLRQGGRIAVISYHSLEDRIVKNFFKTGNFEGILVKDFFGRQITPLKPVTRKAIIPTDVEIGANPRSRSAKLRIAEKL